MTDPEHSKPDWTDWFRPMRFVLLLALMVVAAYPEVVFGTHSFFYRDLGLFTYPVSHYTRESLWNGEVPLWNPLSNCGTPFLAQWNTAVCYPLSLVYLLLPMPWSLNYFLLGHLMLAGMAMYALAFRWTDNSFAASFAGLAFALNGLTLNCVMWTGNLAALAWLPLVILHAEKAWKEGGEKIAVAALVGAMQMLTGSPEVIMLTWLLCATLWAGQFFGQQSRPAGKLMARFIIVVVLVCGLCAFQLLPFFELLQNSARPQGAAGGEWTMPAWGLANLVVPLFRCSPSLVGVCSQFEQQGASSCYFGIGVLAVGLTAALTWEPRPRWLVVVALIGVLLALGEAGFVYPVLKKLLPVLGVTPFPSKSIVLTVFALPLLAAFGVDNVMRPAAKYSKLVRRGLLVVGAVVLGATLAVLFYARVHPHPAEFQDVIQRNGWTRAGFLVLTILGVFLLQRVAITSVRRMLGLGILVLVGADLLTHAPRQNPVVSNEAYCGASPVQMSSRPRMGGSRAMVSHYAQAWLGNSDIPDPLEYYKGLRSALFDNCNLLEGIPKVNGFYSLSLRNFVEVRGLLYEPTNFLPGLADFVGVEQISAPGERFNWSARKTFLPLVTGGQQLVFATETQTLKAIGSPEFDPRRVVYLPEESRPMVMVTNVAKVEISSVDFSAHGVVVKVRAAQPALVVLAQNYYPCWQAYVDDVPTVLLRANSAFQAVQVPTGEHKVRLVYEDRMFSWGVCISLASLLGCLWRLTALRETNPAAIKPTSPKGVAPGTISPLV